MFWYGTPTNVYRVSGWNYSSYEAVPEVQHPQTHTLSLCGTTLSAGLRSVLYSSITLVASHRSCNRQMVASITACNGVLWTSGLEHNNSLIMASREIMTRKCKFFVFVSFTFFIQSRLIEFKITRFPRA